MHVCVVEVLADEQWNTSLNCGRYMETVFLYNVFLLCIHVTPFTISLTGAGNFPRHTEMLSKLSSRNENMAKFGAENPSDKNNMLWRADWGLKQWIPYLLGKTLIFK